jgi:hypothetical protein
MKAALICFVGCVVAATGYSSNNSRRAEKLALSADRVMIYSELEQREAGVVVTVGPDAFLGHASCGAGVAPSLARVTSIVPNQSSEPTLSSGTSPAGQEPRLP